MKEIIILCHLDQNKFDYYYDVDTERIFYVTRYSINMLSTSLRATLSIVAYSLFRKYTFSFNTSIMYWLTVIIGIVGSIILCVVYKRGNEKSSQQERYYITSADQVKICIKEGKKQLYSSYIIIPFLLLMLGVMGFESFYVARNSILLSICNLLLWMLTLLFVHAFITSHPIKRAKIYRMLSKQLIKQEKRI